MLREKKKIKEICQLEWHMSLIKKYLKVLEQINLKKLKS